MPGLQNSVQRFIENLGLPKKGLTIDTELDSRMNDMRSKTEKDRSIYCKDIQNCMAIAAKKIALLVEKIYLTEADIKKATEKVNLEFRNPLKDVDIQCLKQKLRNLEDQKKEAEVLWDDLRELIPLSVLYKKQN